MHFPFGGVQKELTCKYLFNHSTIASWSLLNMITWLSMQAFANYIKYAKSFYLEAHDCSHSLWGYTGHIE